MRKIILVLMLVAPIVMLAQTGSYNLSGKVGNLNAPAKAYLQQGIKGKNIDSTAIQNGQFEFKGLINDPVPATLMINREGSGLLSPTNEKLKFYLESGTIKVNCLDSLSNAKITGSKINADNDKLLLAMKPLKQKSDAFIADVKLMLNEKKNDQAFRSEIQKRAKLILDETFQVWKDFMKSNPDSYLSLNLLKQYGQMNSDYAKIAPLYNTLSAEVKHTEGGIAYAAYLEKINSKEYIDSLVKSKGIPIGALAPEFTQNDTLGKPIKLSDFKGKYVLVDFWASWCGPCRGENPNVLKAYSIYHKKGLEILGISLDTKKEAWIKAINDDKLIWKHVSDLKGWKNEVGVLYRINSVPANLLIDPTGKVIAKNLRGEALDKKLAEILK